tara:strand:+ start:125 stop:406 length:282 start_codon:yes stop_codon:yes gene_type:complete
VIKSFGSAETEQIFKGKFAKKLPNQIQAIARRKLRMITNAHALEDLKQPPGNRLEPLKGDRKGQYSIRINDQWRIVFEWKDGDAFSVEIVDHH